MEEKAARCVSRADMSCGLGRDSREVAGALPAKTAPPTTEAMTAALLLPLLLSMLSAGGGAARAGGGAGFGGEMRGEGGVGAVRGATPPSLASGGGGAGRGKAPRTVIG